MGTPQCGGSGRGSSKHHAHPNRTAHDGRFVEDNAARPRRNVGSALRFPYESDKLTKGTEWSSESGDAGRRAHKDHAGTNHREHFAGQLS